MAEHPLLQRVHDWVDAPYERRCCEGAAEGDEPRWRGRVGGMTPADPAADFSDTVGSILARARTMPERDRLGFLCEAPYSSRGNVASTARSLLSKGTGCNDRLTECARCW